MVTRIAVVIAALAALSGCASITQGTTQTLIFAVTPPTARCVLTREGDGELGSVSGEKNTISVSKDKDDIIVNCKADGYANKTMRIVSKVQTAGVVGAVFIDLGITDLITGAMFAYPSDVTITMEPLAGQGPVPTAATATTPVPETASVAVPATATTSAPAIASGWLNKRLTYSLQDPISGHETGTTKGRLSTDASGTLRIDEDAFVIDSHGIWKGGNWLPVAVVELPTPIAFTEGNTLTLTATAYSGSTMKAEVLTARRATLNLSGVVADVWQLSIAGNGTLLQGESPAGTTPYKGELEMDAASGLITRLRLRASPAPHSVYRSPFETSFALKSID